MRQDFVWHLQAESDGGGCSLFSPLPPPPCTYWSVLLAGGIRKQTPGAFSDLLWLFSCVWLFSPPVADIPIHQDWVDLTALLGGRSSVCLFLCQAPISLFKACLKQGYTAETRSLLKGPCVCISLQGFTGGVINRSCFFCRTCRRSPERAGLVRSLYHGRATGKWLRSADLRRWWESES